MRNNEHILKDKHEYGRQLTKLILIKNILTFYESEILL